MAFCPKCGKEIAANAKFCDACGASIEVAAATNAPPAGANSWAPGPTGAPPTPPAPPTTQGYSPASGSTPQSGPMSGQSSQGNAAGTTTGIQRNVAGLLCYLFLWVSGLVFFFIEKDRSIKFHAMQSILLFGGLQIVHLILGVVIAAVAFGSFALAGLLGLLSTVIWIGELVLWILLMVKAYNNEQYKLPLVGDLAEKYSA